MYIYIWMVLLSYEPLNDLIFALRSILAAQCIEGFRSVPRTYHSHFCHSSPMHTHIHICATLPSVTTSLESQLPYKSPLLYVTTSRSRHLPKSPLHRVSLFVDNSEDCFLASFDIYIYIYRVPCFNSHTLDPSLPTGMTAATQQTDDSARQKKRKRALFARAYVTRLYNYESVLPH